MQRMGLANHQYIIIRHSGTESKKGTSPPAQTGKTGLPFRGTVPGQLDREKGNGSRQRYSKERNLYRSQDIGKAIKAEITALWTTY
ncbi:hypothetical protein [Bacteroides faecis]|nr:hypothetical protein [Bacteroides faecis]MCS2477103.1 relaxase/mobilization nuclease domain-containing protein [Bacteroides faecis]